MINIKKYIKTFIFVCFLFVSFITIAKADNSIVIQRVNNLDCDAAIKHLKNFTSTKDEFNYTFKVKSGLKEAVSEKITCTYDGGEAGNGFQYKVDYTLSATPPKEEDTVTHYVINYTGTSEEKFDFVTAFQLQGISNFTVTKGSQYVKINGCNGGTVCNMQVVDTNDSVDTHSAFATFKYKSGDKMLDADVTMTVKYIGNISAHPGALGTCTMGGDWLSDHIGKTYTDMSGHTYVSSFYLSKRNTNITFGKCTPNEPDVLKFVGWAPAENGDAFEAGVGQLVGHCATFDGLVKANQKVAVPAHYYSACYEYVPSVKLKGLNGGTLKDTAGVTWKTYRQTAFIATASKGTDTIKLPSVSYTDYNKANGTDIRFIGWFDGKKTYKAGDTVAADGITLTPMTENKSTTVNYYKNVYKDNIFKLQVPNASSCSTTKTDIVSTEFKNDVCEVKGLKITGEKDYAPVVVKKKDGTSVTYKFKVLSTEKESGYVFDENNIPIIEPESKAGETDLYTTAHGDGTGEMIEDNKCGKYIVMPLPESGIWNRNGMKSGTFNVKCVDPDDPLSGVLALCLDPGLMGPEKGDAKYVKSFDVKAGSDFSKLLDYLSKHIKDAKITDPNDPVRVAYHIAVRIVGLQYFDNGHDKVLKDNYDTYKAAAKVLSDYGLDKNITNATAEEIAKQMLFIRESDIGKKVNDDYTIKTADRNFSKEVRKALIKVLENYRKEYDENEKKDTTDYFTNRVHSVYKKIIGSKSNSNGYKLTYKGTFTLPKGAKVKSVTVSDKAKNTAKFGFKIESFDYKKLDEPDEFGRVQFDYTAVISVPDASKAKEPKAVSDKVDKSVKIDFDGSVPASMSVLQPSESDGSSYQRMISIDTSSPWVYLYLPPGSGKATCDPSDATDPDCPHYMCKNTKSLDVSNCTDSSHCSNFNKELFASSGCCAFLEDEGSYVSDVLCKGTCAETNMQSTCQYRPYSEEKQSDLYEIREGSHLNKTTNKLENTIGMCIVNVNAPVNAEYVDKSSFIKEDAAGNSIMVSEYEKNTYCRVSCKEDFRITLGAFGNYVGASVDKNGNAKKGAVAAGDFFYLDDDIYMGGTRTCYTSFIDYNKYLHDLVVLSGKITDGFNLAFEGSYKLTAIYYNNEGSVVENKEEVCKGDIAECSCKGNGNDGYDYTYNYDENGNITSVKSKTPCKCSGTAVGGYKLTSYPASVGNGDKYCNSGSWTAYYYDYSTPETSTYGATGHSAVPGSPKHSEYYQNDNTTTSASVGGSGVDLHDEEDNLYSCAAKHGDSSQSTECKSREKQTVYDEKIKHYESDYEGVTISGRGEMSGAYSDMLSLAREYYDCTHFQLNPTEIGNKANNAIQNGVYWGDPEPHPKHGFLGKTRDYVQIDSKFDPVATYTYDEQTMVDIIGEDNEVEEYTLKNNNTFNVDDYNKLTNARAKYRVVEGKQLYLERNYITYGFFPGQGKNHAEPWGDNSPEAANYYSNSGYVIEGNDIENIKSSSKAVEKAKTSKAGNVYKKTDIVLCSIYGGSGNNGGSPSSATVEVKEGATMEVGGGGGGGGTDYFWHGGNCYSATVYYNETAYVSTSISNSSIYRNKGSWIKSEVNGSYEHGLRGSESDLVRNALEKANSKRGMHYNIEQELSKPASGSGVYGGWSVIAVSDNVFPVSFITPRNLYTYTYTFSNIGMFGDGSQRGKLGRILGDDNSLIKENERTCFYEVYETTCICCGGERISTYGTLYSNKKEITTKLEKSEEKINEFVKDNPQMKSKVSDKKAMEVNDSGVISINTSTVSPSDLNGAPDRKLASNFGQYEFDFEGGKYITLKGETVKTAIEAAGENIYNEAPEYIYKLTPSAIKQIQEYNQEHPYGIDDSNIRLYEQKTIVPLDNCTNGESCKWDVNASSQTDRETFVSNYVSFAHVGSGFLEDVAEEFVPEGYTTLASSNKVCAIIDEAAKNPDKIRSMVVDDKCRWIDYIETTNVKNGNKKALTYNNVSNKKSNTKEVDAYFRLSFK